MAKAGARTAVTAFTAVAVTLVANGCGTVRAPEQPPAQQAVVPVAVSTVTSERDLELPLDSYGLGAEERAVVQRARGTLLVACMAQYGLKVTLPTQTPVLYPRNAAFLGWLGAKQVSRYGYSGPPGQLLEEASASSGLRPFPPVEGLQGAVFSGDVETAGGKRVPLGGCNAAVERLLNRGEASLDGRSPVAPFADRQLESFAADAAEQAYADVRLREADKAWSSCMRVAGYAYGRPADARLDRRWATRESEPAGTAEKRVATADERCQASTNYVGVRKALYTDYQQRVVRSNETTLRWISGLLRARLATAREILGDRSGRIRDQWLEGLGRTS
ncbi:hypothetical protein [Streptosporangium jomthongense]|uniref:Lipoprotein n=1 Tax=Streptosporangium jomthongense TaxID=1193683 RepID=A0ABV8EV28_9ACTN